ncbi:unnamed protein product [Durusdinium trenchii]|uniref:Uncharacterized protein n=1 Tax=Durusdinium trenchii TaxID=1381693 RepID=A0ABP0QT64_9DINO
MGEESDTFSATQEAIQTEEPDAPILELQAMAPEEPRQREIEVADDHTELEEGRSRRRRKKKDYNDEGQQEQEKLRRRRKKEGEEQSTAPETKAEPPQGVAGEELQQMGEESDTFSATQEAIQTEEPDAPILELQAMAPEETRQREIEAADGHTELEEEETEAKEEGDEAKKSRRRRRKKDDHFFSTSPSREDGNQAKLHRRRRRKEQDPGVLDDLDI